jgi:urease accessory protein
MPAASLLHLMWLASPALPVGGFSYSEGLETAVEAGRVRDESEAGDWLLNQLELSLARSELPLLAQAHRAWADHDAARIAVLQAWHHATRETAELRRQGEQMGRSLLDWLRHSPWATDPRLQTLADLSPAPGWPIGFALATVLADADTEHAALAFAFGWAENMVQAAMKAVPLGQVAAQRMLGRLTAAIPAAVEQALARPDERRQAFAPMLAILSARHETQYSRLFRS